VLIYSSIRPRGNEARALLRPGPRGHRAARAQAPDRRGVAAQEGRRSARRLRRRPAADPRRHWRGLPRGRGRAKTRL